MRKEGRRKKKEESYVCKVIEPILLPGRAAFLSSNWKPRGFDFISSREV
jgi:hypothetical protein